MLDCISREAFKPIQFGCNGEFRLLGCIRSILTSNHQRNTFTSILLGRPRDLEIEKSRPLVLACLAAATICGAAEEAGSKDKRFGGFGPFVAVQNVPRAAVISSS